MMLVIKSGVIKVSVDGLDLIAVHNNRYNGSTTFSIWFKRVYGMLDSVFPVFKFRVVSVTYPFEIHPLNSYTGAKYRLLHSK